jgi:hypothetical protein
MSQHFIPQYIQEEMCESSLSYILKATAHYMHKLYLKKNYYHKCKNESINF